VCGSPRSASHMPTLRCVYVFLFRLLSPYLTDVLKRGASGFVAPVPGFVSPDRHRSRGGGGGGGDHNFLHPRVSPGDGHTSFGHVTVRALVGCSFLFVYNSSCTEAPRLSCLLSQAPVRILCPPPPPPSPPLYVPLCWQLSEALMHTGGSDPPAPGDLDLSWSFSGMSVSGSMSHRLPHDLEGGLDASGLGLEIVGKSISGLGGSFGGGGGGGGGGSGHHHARAPAGSMGPPLSSATPARPPPLAFPTHMQSHVPSASVVAQQLHHVSESFKTGLISPEERSMWKDHIITRASGEVW
jgi:hypothetical protein